MVADSVADETSASFAWVRRMRSTAWTWMVSRLSRIPPNAPVISPYAFRSTCGSAVRLGRRSSASAISWMRLSSPPSDSIA